MLRKRISVVPFVIVAAALAFTGCSTTLKSNTIQAVTLTPKVRSSLTLADLDVSEKKVMGKASGQLPVASRAGLERDAITNAVEQRDGADVLVGATFFYEQTGRVLTVTVTGFPATYKNFRAYEPGVAHGRTSTQGVFSEQSEEE